MFHATSMAAHSHLAHTHILPPSAPAHTNMLAPTHSPTHVHAQTHTHKCMYSQFHQQPCISPSSLMSTCFALECCASGNCPCCQSDLCLLCCVVDFVCFQDWSSDVSQREWEVLVHHRTPHPQLVCCRCVCGVCGVCVRVCMCLWLVCLLKAANHKRPTGTYNKCELCDTAPIECLDSCSVCYCC